MKTKRQFILDTLLPYKQDPKTCAFIGGKCLYLTKDGRKCAVGKHMKKGEWQKSENSISGLLGDIGLELKDILTKEAVEQGLTLREWNALQAYHDSIGFGDAYSDINLSVEHLEKVTGLKFPELYF